MRAVRFEKYGDVDVLDVVEVPEPVPGPGEVLVRVVAAGINPGEAAIRRGDLDSLYPAHFPEGQGSDFAGVVELPGVGVTEWDEGDEVVGWSSTRSAQAEYVVVPAGNLVEKPKSAEWEVAAGLYVAGSTGWACVQAVRPAPGETVVVSAAAGGVGVWACQLSLRAGATVIGTASDDNFDFLRSIGVKPVLYGEGLADRLRAQAPRGIDAYIDTYGGGNVEVALELGVPASRINTIADFEAPEKYGVKGDGSAVGTSPAVLAELAELVASRHVIIPLSAIFPLDDVRDAYRELEHGHTRGKIVLGMNPIEHISRTHKGAPGAA